MNPADNIPVYPWWVKTAMWIGACGFWLALSGLILGGLISASSLNNLGALVFVVQGSIMAGLVLGSLYMSFFNRVLAKKSLYRDMGWVVIWLGFAVLLTIIISIFN